jgi:hypothetical protein
VSWKIDEIWVNQKAKEIRMKVHEDFQEQIDIAEWRDLVEDGMEEGKWGQIMRFVQQRAPQNGRKWHDLRKNPLQQEVTVKTERKVKLGTPVEKQTGDLNIHWLTRRTVGDNYAN